MKIKEFVPYLSVHSAREAIAFYSKMMGTDPYLLLNMPDGRVMHCEFRIGNVRFFISDELPEHGGTASAKTIGSTPVAIHLYVDDCDSMVAGMKTLGAEVMMEPSDMFWGERFARVRDPFGHEWGISEQLREMDPREIEKTVKTMFEEAPE